MGTRTGSIASPCRPTPRTAPARTTTGARGPPTPTPRSPRRPNATPPRVARPSCSRVDPTTSRCISGRRRARRSRSRALPATCSSSTPPPSPPMATGSRRDHSTARYACGPREQASLFPARRLPRRPLQEPRPSSHFARLPYQASSSRRFAATWARCTSCAGRPTRAFSRADRRTRPSRCAAVTPRHPLCCHGGECAGFGRAVLPSCGVVPRVPTLPGVSPRCGSSARAS